MTQLISVPTAASTPPGRLLRNVANAARRVWPHYLRSIFGEPASWDLASSPHSELGQVQAGSWRRALGEVVQVTVPAVPWRPAGPLFPGASLLFRPCTVLHQARPDGAAGPAPDEAWMFINGICTDQEVARINAAYLVELFGRPLTILHDSTCGLIPDLIECAAGKGWGSLTAAGRLALHPLAAALLNPDQRKVVLLCHSRGTIIAAAVLHALACAVRHDGARLAPGTAEARAGERLYREWRDRAPAMQRALRRQDVRAALTRHGGDLPEPEPQHLSAEHLHKLEVYAVANCASDMRHIVPAEGPRPAAPYIESLGNEHDLVACLGVLAARKGPGGVRIDGNAYYRPGAWGHLLNAHYLDPLERDVQQGRQGLLPMAGTLEPSRLQEMLRQARAATAAGDRAAARAA
jgi:hypothetical protein